MKIELLTPVHISTGEEIPFYEWKADSSSNRWVRIDLLKLPSLPPDDVLRDFDKLKLWCEDEKSLSWDNAFKSKMYGARVAQGIRLPIQGTEIFRECMKNQSTLEPIIPGSSLKGAILTGYLYSGYESQGRFKRGANGERILDRSVKEELRRFFSGTENPVSDFSPRLKVSDIAFSQSTLRIDLAERRMRKAGNQRQWVECIPSGAVSRGKISLGSEHDVDDKIAPQMRPLRKKDVKKLVKRCNNFAKAVITAEEEYYDYVRQEHRVTLPKHYKLYGIDYVDKLPPKKCLVRVGWGSNKNAVSVVLLNSNPNLAIRLSPKSERYRPKSRWLLSGKIPPGWCLVKFEEGDWVE